jgi:hypothetical protein
MMYVLTIHIAQARESRDHVAAASPLELASVLPPPATSEAALPTTNAASSAPAAAAAAAAATTTEAGAAAANSGVHAHAHAHRGEGLANASAAAGGAQTEGPALGGGKDEEEGADATCGVAEEMAEAVKERDFTHGHLAKMEEAMDEVERHYSQFTCFTRTKVQILTPELLRRLSGSSRWCGCALSRRPTESRERGRASWRESRSVERTASGRERMRGRSGRKSRRKRSGRERSGRERSVRRARCALVSFATCWG